MATAPGVVGLDAILGIAGVIGVDLRHVRAKRGVVAGVTADDGQRVTLRASDPKDRNAFIGGSGGVFAELDPRGRRLSAAQGEVGSADAVGQADWFHPGQSRANRADDLVLEVASIGGVRLHAFA